MDIDFKYCLWFIFNDGCELKNLTNGFNPHISIKTKLNKTNALELYSKINNNINKKIKIIIIPEYIISNTNGFIALFYKVDFSDKNIIKKPIWWPKNAHLSIRYKYNENITDEEIKSIKLKKIEYETDKIIIMKCTNHHSTWEKILQY